MKKVLLLTALICVGIIKAQEDTKDKFILEKGTWNLSHETTSSREEVASQQQALYIEPAPTQNAGISSGMIS